MDVESDESWRRCLAGWLAWLAGWLACRLKFIDLIVKVIFFDLLNPRGVRADPAARQGAVREGGHPRPCARWRLRVAVLRHPPGDREGTALLFASSRTGREVHRKLLSSEAKRIRPHAEPRQRFNFKYSILNVLWFASSKIAQHTPRPSSRTTRSTWTSSTRRRSRTS